MRSSTLLAALGTAGLVAAQTTVTSVFVSTPTSTSSTPCHPHQQPPPVTFPPFPPPRAPIPVQPPRPVHSLPPPVVPEEFVVHGNEHKRNHEELPPRPHPPVHSLPPLGF
ncbi:hypothetical protein B0H65DRAFT_443054 [Neurospora tetraspora]|uniref:Uncharacterized protein n=1 Tax=Neurospora tetraspora TaxID=94610 RepID=A0AAE0JGW8_9PEZI|nr:hypothetical protein B0H65DRAFT_443054 [Neurospora tetraspora]